jgi:ribose 5-phosphate isomerase A
MDSIDNEKKLAARAAVALIPDGSVVGIGAGSTVNHAVRALGERVAEGLKVKIVPASIETENLARSLGIEITGFEQHPHFDIAIDGADEMDPQLRLLKGGGGALLREKVVATAAKEFIVIADSSKTVEHLGKFPLPVEVLPFALWTVFDRVRKLGVEPILRKKADGSTYETNQHNYILDCPFGKIEDPDKLAADLACIPGLIEHGLFLTEASVALVARGETVETIRRKN